jgi:hypothetical protein
LNTINRGDFEKSRFGHQQKIPVEALIQTLSESKVGKMSVGVHGCNPVSKTSVLQVCFSWLEYLIDGSLSMD